MQYFHTNNRRGESATEVHKPTNKRIEESFKGIGPIETDRKTAKLKTIQGYVFCTCMELFNTGFPCPHMFNVALRHGLKLLFAERWFV